MSRSSLAPTVRPFLPYARWTAVAVVLLPLATWAQQPAFETKSGTLRNGVHVTQVANAGVFPDFDGTRGEAPPARLPRTDASSFRSVRIVAPLDTSRGTMAALAVRPQSDGIGVTLDADSLSVVYRGPLSSDNDNPFMESETGATPAIASHNAEGWLRKIPMTRRISADARYLLITAYLFPSRAQDAVDTLGGNVILAITEARVEGQRIVPGAWLAPPVKLRVPNESWERWSEQRIVARAGYLSANPESGDPETLVLAEQRVIAFDTGVDSTKRVRRCAEDWLGVFTAWSLERMFSAPSYCLLDPAKQAPAKRLALIDIEPLPEPPGKSVMSDLAWHLVDTRNANAFYIAMAGMLCDSEPDGEETPTVEPERICTADELEAIQAMSGLSPHTMRAVLDEIERGDASPGRTGNARLDHWINANQDAARNALYVALGIVRRSDAHEQRTRPVSETSRNASVLAATCQSDMEVADASEEPWERCKTKARKRANLTRSIVAMPPHIELAGRFYLRDKAEDAKAFRKLVNWYGNTGLPHPEGISASQFSQAMRAIGIDAAPTGRNLNMVYLPDVPRLNKKHGRPEVGLEHIWWPGSGGGPNAGHRDEWIALGRASGIEVERDMVATIVMSALTSPSAALAPPKLQANRRDRRVFTRVRFTHRGETFEATHIVVVLERNGMVVTAFPLGNATLKRVPHSNG